MSEHEKPILFSAEMVRAILDGRKTQTRRVITQCGPYHPSHEYLKTWLTDRYMYKCPYGKPGDLLWVRETWQPSPEAGVDYPGFIGSVPAETVEYAADYNSAEYADLKPWKPSIFMPRWASRITLRITDVRVERVQEISVEDCYAEGVRNEHYPKGSIGSDRSVRQVMFPELWDSINAKRGYGWDINPWVWVIEFERATP